MVGKMVERGTEEGWLRKRRGKYRVELFPMFWERETSFKGKSKRNHRDKSVLVFHSNELTRYFIRNQSSPAAKILGHNRDFFVLFETSFLKKNQ